jgi:hypothetical protein
MDQWVVLMKVGPFTVWSVCVAYTAAWEGNTRGADKKQDRGIRLFEAYHTHYGLLLWAQTRRKEELPRLPILDETRKKRVRITLGQGGTEVECVDASFKLSSTAGQIKKLCLEQGK